LLNTEPFSDSPYTRDCFALWPRYKLRTSQCRHQATLCNYYQVSFHHHNFVVVGSCRSACLIYSNRMTMVLKSHNLTGLRKQVLIPKIPKERHHTLGQSPGQAKDQSRPPVECDKERVKIQGLSEPWSSTGMPLLRRSFAFTTRPQPATIKP
jgi:hypothetical protein